MLSTFVERNGRLRSGASILVLAGALTGTMGLVAPAAYAACTADANNNSTCTGANTTPLTLYDQAARFQPVNGSKAYTPMNPAFPAASNPNNPGYNPDPPTQFLTIAPGATYTSLPITAANRTTALADNGLIVANYADIENPAVNNVTVNNFGVATLTNTQSANRASTIVADSQINTFTVNNNAGGAIVASQQAATFAGFNAANLSAPLAGTPPAATARYNGATFAITSAFYSDDNTNAFVLNNAANASVTATGRFATPYYGRADTTVTNSGTIANTDYVPGESISAGHWALTAYAGTEYTTAPNTNPDSVIVLPNSNGTVTINETTALTVTNNAGGTIRGDILALDITPLVYAAAVGTSANQFANPAQAVLNLPVTGQNAGPRDSNITNMGTIIGSLHLGSGEHVIDNAAGATLQGSAYVDQRPVVGNFSVPTPGTAAGTYLSNGGTAGVDFNGNRCPAAGQNTTNPGCAGTTTKAVTVVGAQSFTLTNEGTFTGDVRILDQATSVNSIALTGTGFAGNLVAVNGTGMNSLTLDGVTNLSSVQNFSTVDLMQSKVAVTNGVSLVGGATLATTIYGGGIAAGNQVGSIQGQLTLQGATTIAPTLASFVRNGDTYQLASAVTAAGPITVAPTSALVSFTPSTSNGSLQIQAVARDARTVPGVSAAGGATLNALTSYGGSNSNVQALGTAAEALTTNAQVAVAANALSPIVNGADIQLPINSTLLFHQQVDARLDSFIYGQVPQSGRSADLGVPRPAVALVPANEVWVEGVDGGVHQSQVGAVNGYNADFAGIIGGADRLIQPNLRVGAAVGFINADTNYNVNLSGNRESIQTYQGLVYAEYVAPRAYVRGSIGDGGVNYNQTRQINFAGFNDTASGGHSGNVFTARGEAGLPLEALSGLVIPYAAFTYNHLSQAGYTESSYNGAALTVAGARNDSERAEAGAKLVVPIGVLPVFSRLSLGALAVTAEAAYVHDFGNVTQQVTASFAGGNVFIATGPTPNRDFVNGGAGLRLVSGPVLVDLSYNALARSTYLQQVGLLKAKLLF